MAILTTQVLPIHYLTVPIATLIYLLVDVYPSVKSFRAILRTGSFWLLWIIFSVLNVIAWAGLKLAVGPKILTLLNDPGLTDLTVVILSTLSTLTVLQSLTVKISDYKFLDIGMLIEGFRKSVLADIGSTLSAVTKREEMRLTDKLYTKYQSNRQGLRDEYANIFSGRPLAEIGKELVDLENDAKATSLTFERQLTSRIVKADHQRAEQLLK